MSFELFLIIFFIVLFPLQVILLGTLRKPHEKNIEQWAKKENLKILHSEVVDRSQSPFSWFTTNYSFMFYRVRVINEKGSEKSGYLCVAGQMSPFFSEKVRPKWDQEQERIS